MAETATTPHQKQKFSPRRFLLSGQGWPYLLVPFIPLAILLEFVLHAAPTIIFICAALGVIPTAALMGRATEELANRSGPAVGGLLNVTFGNAPELIIALFALAAGLHEVVKASLIGSILGNILLVMGISMLAGGARRNVQVFNSTAASAQASMLLLAAVALVMPTMFQLVGGGGLPQVGENRREFSGELERMSFAVAVVLLLSYAGGILFTLRSHLHLFNHEEHEEEVGHTWSVRTSMLTLAGAGIAVGLMSEILVGSIEAASEGIGISEFFIGLIVVAIVGNAAEHWVAVYFAIRDRMGLSVNIAVGSSAQIALFVAPVLVIASFVLGPGPMPLVFSGYELGAVVLALLIANLVIADGESTWFEGLQLLAVYAVLGIVFFFA